MRVLSVCVAAACTGVARVAPQHSGSDDAAGISARALVRGRGRCCHSLNSNNSNNSFTHSFTPNSTPCPGWAAIWVAHSLFAPPRPSSACLPPPPQRGAVDCLTIDERTRERQPMPADLWSAIRFPFPSASLRSDPNPITIVACGGDRFVGLASRCAVAKSEKGNGRLKMTTITQA